MSLKLELGSDLLHRFPRVSGDEPALCEAVKCLGVFSPRERG